MEESLLGHFDEMEDCTVVAGWVDGRLAPVAVVRARAELPPDILDRANGVLRAIGQPALARLERAVDQADLPVGVTGKVLKRLLRDKYGAG
jgi:acyl-coenzyme A synthetase/AMP-(fatty) acid ligase